MQRLRFTFLSAGFALCLFVGMVSCLAIGRKLGIDDLARYGAEGRAGVGLVDSAVYSLLALLIGFTFSGAATRFDRRREMVAQEINTLGTAWQRIDVLPAGLQPPIRDSFREYLDELLALYLHPRSAVETLRESPALTRLQNDMWTRSVAACTTREGDAARMLLLPALNDMFGAVEKERIARRIHPPIAIFAMLAITALAAALFAGYGLSNGPHNWMHVLGVAGTVSLAAYNIIDLEFPRLGLIRIDSMDRVLLELHETMG